MKTRAFVGFDMLKRAVSMSQILERYWLMGAVAAQRR